MSIVRQEYNENTPWWGEHKYRYQCALNYIKSTSIVLDIACGNGYGTDILSGATTEVITGGDISEEALNFCKMTFSHNSKIRFLLIDASQIPFNDNGFDVITSFETIEHSRDYRTILNEFNRVLKSNGTIIISTPNFCISSPNGKITNPFHTQEFTYNEFKQLLQNIFNDVKIYGQKYNRYKNNTFKFQIAYIIEKMFYLRGIRKIPISIQNAIMNLLIKKNFYPSTDDYTLTSDMNEILQCSVFFAVAKKRNN